MRTTLVVLLLTCPVGLQAQRIWITPDAGRNFGVDVRKVFFKDAANLGFFSVEATIDARLPINDKVAVTLAVPGVRLADTGPQYRAPTETLIGNPWIGVEATVSRSVAIEAGIRPGLSSEVDEAKEDALTLGIFSDFDHFEAWLPHTTSVRAAAHFGTEPARGTFVSGYLGGTVAIPPGSSATKLYANYGARLGVVEESVIVGIAVTGRLNVSDATSLDEGTVHQVAFVVEKRAGSFRPNASIGTYLDESLREDVRAIVSIGATIRL